MTIQQIMNQQSRTTIIQQILIMKFKIQQKVTKKI